MRESIPVTSRLAPLKANNEAASHAKYSNLVESVRKLYSPDQMSVEVMPDRGRVIYRLALCTVPERS